MPICERYSSDLRALFNGWWFFVLAEHYQGLYGVLRAENRALGRTFEHVFLLKEFYRIFTQIDTNFYLFYFTKMICYRVIIRAFCRGAKVALFQYHRYYRGTVSAYHFHLLYRCVLACI